MKIKNIINLLCLLTVGFVKAQFQVGHMSINFKDASRSGGYTISGGINMPGTGRTIGTEVYYPSATAGNNVAVATGTFPVVVFGHGFAMAWDSYDNVYNRLAALGYIVLLPRTEGGTIFPPPNHADFGIDLKLIANQALSLNTISTPTALTTFNGKVLQKSAIGGHSMGAGASFLAAANNSSLTCLFNFAAATTNNSPNSVASASLVSIPSLVISGEKDNVADTTVQNSHYNGLASTKKFHVIIKDLTHCEFGNGTSGTCNIGQSSCGNTTCNTNFFRRYMTYLEPFLAHQLKGSCPAGKQFMDTIQASSNVRPGRKITGTLVTLPTINISGGGVNVCVGNQVTLTASGASTYSWTGGVTNNIAFAASSTQNYTVTGTDALGCQNTKTTSITVNQGPTVTITPTISAICQGQSIGLTASGATTYTWSHGGANGANLTPTATTIYTVTATGASTCAAIVTKTITVNLPPTISITPTLTSICADQSINLTANGANTYTWNHGGSNGSSQSPSVTTTYTVNATSATGCTNTAVKTISITSSPSITVNGGGICSGQSFTINPSGADTYSVTGGTLVVTPTTTSTYSVTGSLSSGCAASNTAVVTITVTTPPVISVNSGSICAGQSFTINPSGASSYTVSGGNLVVNPTSNSSYTVTGSNIPGCQSNPVVSTVSVIAIPTLTLNTSESILCAGQTAVVSASGASSYTWNTGATTSSISVTPSVTTSYTVNARNTEGCVATSQITQNVSTCTSTDGQIDDSELFNIYPNPNAGIFMIQSIENTSYTIYDAFGRKVQNAKLLYGSNEINLDTQAKGMYYIIIENQQKQKMYKIIIE
jgi:dienelactone hydrolase